jgi:hypothetical protein
VVAVAVAGLVVWSPWEGDQPEAASDPGTSAPTTGANPDSPGTSQPAVDGGAEFTPACAEAAASAVAAVDALSAALTGSDIVAESTRARQSALLLPGAPAFEEQMTAATTGATTENCPTATMDQQFLTEVAVRSGGDPMESLVVDTAERLGWVGAVEILDTVALSLAHYPHHGLVPAAPPQVTVPDTDLPRWIVVLESLETTDYTRTDAVSRFTPYDRLGLDPQVLLSDDYGSLNPGYWAIYTGWYEDRQAARDLCASIRSSVDFCYERYLQTLPSSSATAGSCGPYGTVRTVGSSSVPVYLGPSSSSNQIATVSGDGIYLAGFTEVVGGVAWLPVEVNGTIGWVEAGTLTSGTCTATPSSPAPECADVSRESRILLTDIFRAADSSDSALPEVLEAFDARTQALVEDAGAGSCDLDALNANVASHLGGIGATGPVTAGLRQLLLAYPLFGR